MSEKITEKTTVPLSLVFMIGGPILTAALAFTAVYVQVDGISSKLDTINQVQINQGTALQNTQLDVNTLKTRQDTLQGDVNDIKSILNRSWGYNLNQNQPKQPLN